MAQASSQLRFISALHAQITAPGLVKVALRPNVARVVVDAARKAELAGLGKSVFNKAYRGPDYFSSLYNTALSGYKQLSNIHGEREGFARALKAIKPRTMFASTDPRHATYMANRRAIMDKHKGTMEDLYAELGTTAEGRQKMVRRTGQIGGGAAAGIGGGYLAGNILGKKNQEQTFENMPMLERLKHLFNPRT